MAFWRKSIRRWLRRLAVVAFGACVPSAAGCGSTSSAPVADAGTDQRVPECDGVANPFWSASCLSGLRAFCRELASREMCEAAAPFSSYNVVCTWARVVTISDPSACTIASDEGRCEGGWTYPNDGLFCDSWYGFAAERELLKLSTCGGPVGPWDAIGAVPGSVEGPCMPNVVPPAPPICSCVDVLSRDAGDRD